jgi:hypothetical protein
MNFFDKLKAQVNMNDGGKTFSNPSANPDASQMPSGMRMRPSQPIQQFEDGSSRVGRIGVSVGDGHSYGANINGAGNYPQFKDLQGGQNFPTQGTGMESENNIDPQGFSYGLGLGMNGVQPVDMDSVPGQGFYQDRGFTRGAGRLQGGQVNQENLLRKLLGY